MNRHFLFFLLGGLSYGTSKPIDKSCIQHARIQQRVEPCTDPQVPEKILNIASFSACTSSWGSDLCGVVAHALLGDYEIVDVVFLQAGLCHADLEAGPLTLEKVNTIFPFHHELVILHLNGSNLAEALEHGIDQFHFREVPEAYPRVAGVEFHVDLSRPYGQRVTDMYILNHDCHWDPLVLDKTYLVMADEEIARGGYEYSSLAQYQALTPIRHSVAEAFWTYSQAVCEVVDPSSRKVKQAAPKSCPSPTGKMNFTTVSYM